MKPASGHEPPPSNPVTGSYSSRPLRGDRLNDTRALVANGIPPPQGAYELHSRPSAEASVTPPELGGTRDDFFLSGGSLEGARANGPVPRGTIRNSAPDLGNTMRRTMDYMKRNGG